MTEDNCPFCAYFKADKAPMSVKIIKPLNPVTPGHLLFVPAEHTSDAGDEPDVTAEVMRQASTYARRLRACNIITSKGVDATQSVFHLHIHVVPRTAGDGLKLPWTDQVKEAAHV
jgi:histidine triad (HIT) family protein